MDPRRETINYELKIPVGVPIDTELRAARFFLVYPFLVFCFDFLDIKLNINVICPKIKSFMIFFVVLLALFWRGGGGEKVKFASISTHSGYIA